MEMQFIVAVITVQPSEVVMTCTSQRTQTQTRTPTQISGIHTNLLQATIMAMPTPELFWLANITSVHLK